MFNTNREVTVDIVEEWLRAFQSDAYWRAEMGPIVRSTLDAMAVSDTAYTGDDFYEILLSPPARRAFVATEHGKSGVLVPILEAADEVDFETLSRRIQVHG
jgi:hypothetical protein